MIEDVKDYVSVGGFIVSTVALIVTAVNVRQTARTTRARFWLDLRVAFGLHDSVHQKLRPGGAWANSEGPRSVDEMAQVEAYMGLFEHCEIMLEQGMIDERTFSEIYSYRLGNLLANDFVKTAKLKNESRSWPRFIELVERMQKNQ